MTRKNTRARKGAHRRRKSQQHNPQETVTPAARMGIILDHYQRHANAVFCNPPTFHKMPQEALKACRALTESLFRDSLQRDGKHYVYGMLFHALLDIEGHLESLFDCARQVAEGGTS